MKNLYSTIIALIALTYNIFGQDPDQTLQGQVSFVTTQNVYVRFSDTEAINVGDSLKLQNTGTYCLVVKSKSSTSCVCDIVEGCPVQKVITYFIKLQ